MKKILAVIALVLVFAALPVVYAQGGTIEVGQTVDGTLNDSQATYQLSLAEGQAVSISLSSSDFDTYLEVQDKAGNQLAYDDDSGSGTDSALVFVAPSAGVYNLVVHAFSGNATGAYVLAVSETSVVAVTYGTPVSVDENNDVHSFTFQGSAGDLVNISTDNPDVDVRLTLLGPDGSQIASDDDGGPGYAAFIRAAALPTTGTYMIEMNPVSNAVGTLNLLVETTQLTVLGSEPYVTALGGDNPSGDVVAIEAVSGQNYRVTVSADVVASAYIQVEQGDFNWTTLSFYNALESTIVFTSSTDGLINISIDDSSSNGATYTLTVASVN